MGATRATRVKESIYAALDRIAASSKSRWFLIKLHESVGTALGAGNYDDDGFRTGENKVLSAIGSLDPQAILIDLGANNGSWTLEARSRIPKSRVIAIEPGSGARATLTERTVGDLNVLILPFAVGITNGQHELFGVDDAVRASLNADLLSRTTRTGQQEIPSELIEVRDWATTLVFVKGLGIDLNHEAPTGIKLDIEGLELDVLKQIVAWDGLASVRVIQFEFNMHAIAQGQLIADFQQVLGSGFTLFRLSKHALIALSELSDAEANYFGFSNWVAVRNADVSAFVDAFRQASGAMVRAEKWRS